MPCKKHMRYCASLLFMVLLCIPLVASRAWESEDLFYDRASDHIHTNEVFSYVCNLPSTGSTVCDPDLILGPDGSKRLGTLIATIADGEPPYTLTKLLEDGRSKRGRWIAVVAVRSSDIDADAFARAVYGSWLSRRCGSWSGCSNAVVFTVVADTKAVGIYAGNSEIAVAMKPVIEKAKKQMAAAMDKWDNNAVTNGLMEAVEVFGRLTQPEFVEPEKKDTANWILMYILAIMILFLWCG